MLKLEPAPTVIVVEAGPTPIDQMAEKRDVHSLGFTAIVILCWYTANIMLLMLNKFLLSSTAFRQPVFLTLCHMSASVVIALAIAGTGYLPLKALKSRLQFAKICILSVIFCASIVSACRDSTGPCPVPMQAIHPHRCLATPA